MPVERARLESIVATIWTNVLEVATVRPGDNFLDLGGNSLRAGEIAWRIREEVGVEVPIDVVLDEPTLGDLVTAIESLLGNATEVQR
jgi:acyl carrier protein